MKTLEDLKKSGHILFECISGSRAYGLDTDTSDVDIRGVFVLPRNKYFGMGYTSQINNESNDIVYYELRKFVELCAKNNPNMLELINIPEPCILYKHPLFDRFSMSLFLSKKCEYSFANYAYAQIAKARGLEKKIVNPVDKIRKSVLDFCYVLDNNKSTRLLDYLKKHDLLQEQCGLARIPHMSGCFNLFHNKNIPYKGIAKNDASNDVAVSSIPEGEKPLAMMYFNKDGYSAYCKKYKSYWEWVEKRNDTRYQATIEHGKNYDSKNMMHTFRLLHMAKEIALESCIHVHRDDREFLLNVKMGKYEYDDLVMRAEKLKQDLVQLFSNSNLPDEPNLDKINSLLTEVRVKFYDDVEQRL